MNAKIRLSILVNSPANGCNMCWPTTPNTVDSVGYGCYTLRPFAHRAVVACFWELLGKVLSLFK